MKHGVHSETGRLRKVLVCRPGLAQQRLTPHNCAELLFDDVMWVAQAKTDHYAFTSLMQDRGIEVLELHDLLADVLALPAGRAWLLARKLAPQHVGLGLTDELHAWLCELPARELAERLIGGVVRAELPQPLDAGLAARGAMRVQHRRTRNCDVLGDRLGIRERSDTTGVGLLLEHVLVFRGGRPGLIGLEISVAQPEPRRHVFRRQLRHALP